jgi:hypothetical protein
MQCDTLDALCSGLHLSPTPAAVAMKSTCVVCDPIACLQPIQRHVAEFMVGVAGVEVNMRVIQPHASRVAILFTKDTPFMA